MRDICVNYGAFLEQVGHLHVFVNDLSAVYI